MYKTLLLSINKLLRIEQRYLKLGIDKIKYDSLKSLDKTYFYELKSDLPQFIVSSDEKEFILQDKNKTIVFGDLLS